VRTDDFIIAHSTGGIVGKTIFDSRLLVHLLHRFAVVFFRVTKWKIIELGDPSAVSSVVVAAPHTTWRDLPYSLLLAFYFKMRIRWVGKKELFLWPFSGLLRWVGGVPVDRSVRSLMTDYCASLLRDADQPFQLVIAPSGTRKNAPVRMWRHGYWNIAKKSKTPILFGFISYQRREAGILGQFYPSSDYESDIARIEHMYRNYVPR
jgi:1-acyl-sn-glycerol-3-phosphate acyltransferase